MKKHVTYEMTCDFVGKIKCPLCKREINVALMPLKKAMVCWWHNDAKKRNSKLDK